MIVATTDAVAELRSTAAIRERAAGLLARARAGDSAWFTVADDRLPTAAALVADVTAERFPAGAIPMHSRWRHFEAGGVDRTARLRALLAGADAAEQARAMIDLAVVSVLLDAGAGSRWRYVEDGREYARSEGLGVTSWQAFVAGLFSSEPDAPLRVDAAGLRGLRPEALATAFQVGAGNPLTGFEGRVALLHRLGDALAARADLFGPAARPGGLFDALMAQAAGAGVTAHAVLSAVLAGTSSIWLAGNVVDDTPVGDCWRHGAVGGRGAAAGWMPFHKLSQWLTYSLVEPFTWAGVPVTGLEDLTGLPEYRNGGLLLDCGVLRLRDPGWADRTWDVADELVVEWRAMTVALLDDLAPLVRAELGRPELPLACILEGGTWTAGRRLAQDRRGGLPPLLVRSDGTVF